MPNKTELNRSTRPRASSLSLALAQNTRFKLIMHKITLFLISLSLNFFASTVVNAESKLQIDLSEKHPIDYYSLQNKGNLWIHNLNDYQVIEVLLHGQCNLKVHEIKKLGEPHNLFKTIASPDIDVLVDGGFFGYTEKGKRTPIGLVQSGGKRLNNILPWTSGGFLVSSNRKIAILPASQANETSKWQEIVQSKPIVIADNKLDVKPNTKDSNFNRVAIATTQTGAIYILGVFQSFGEALTLYEYGKIMLEVAKQRKIDIVKALAMDGGPGAHIYIPQYDLSYGDSGTTYIPNAVSIGDCK